jgi:hypothetical protein
MPPGNLRFQKPVKVIEKATAEACIALAERVAMARNLADDRPGCLAADQVARLIREELLGVNPAKLRPLC